MLVQDRMQTEVSSRGRVLAILGHRALENHAAPRGKRKEAVPHGPVGRVCKIYFVKPKPKQARCRAMSRAHQFLFEIHLCIYAHVRVCVRAHMYEYVYMLEYTEGMPGGFILLP